MKRYTLHHRDVKLTMISFQHYKPKNLAEWKRNSFVLKKVVFHNENFGFKYRQCDIFSHKKIHYLTLKDKISNQKACAYDDLKLHKAT